MIGVFQAIARFVLFESIPRASSADHGFSQSEV